MAYLWLNVAGMAKLHFGSYEEAVAWFRRSVEANRNYPLAIFHLAAALAQLDQLDEAQSAVKASLALNPAFAISRAHASRKARTDDPTYLAGLERISRVCAGQSPRTMTTGRRRKPTLPTSWGVR